jgi:phage terminase large subunit
MSTALQIKTPRWFFPLLSQKHGIRYRAAHGGRGSGKSHAFAELMVERCVAAKTKCVCIRELQKSLSFSVKILIEEKIKYFGVEHLFIIQNDCIKGTNGSLILFQGMQNQTANAIKSLEGFDIAWMEEAQDISEASLKVLRPTIRKPGSEIWATWNPCNEDDPIEFLRNDVPPDSIVVEVNYTDNPWFPDVLTTTVEYDRKRDYDEFKHVWLGQFEESSEARVFNNWSVEEFDTPLDSMFKFGADFGYAVDPTVLVRCYLVGRKLYVDYEAHQHKCEILDTPDLFATIPDSDLFAIVADSSRPETISHLKNHGYPKVYGSVKGKGSIKEGIEWLKTYDIIVHPRCKHTITELNSYKYKVDPHTQKITGVIKDENNHVIDALRYACEGVRRMEKKQVVVKQPVKQRSRW